ncbi:MAG: VOC family protein [Thermoleophilia bacterium]
MNAVELVPELAVESVDRSIRFYVDYLGCLVEESVADDSKTTWSQLSFGGSRIMLQDRGLMEDEFPGLCAGTASFSGALVFRYGSAEDVRELYLKMVELGRIEMPIRKTDYDTMEFAVRDADGYVVLCAATL